MPATAPGNSGGKKVFLILAAIFLLIIAIIIYDFSRKTTFPGRPKPATQR